MRSPLDGSTVMMPCIFALVLIWFLPAAGPKLAGDLRTGMQLVYSSNGSDQSPWSIDSVETGLSLKENADCAAVRIRRRPDQAPPEDRLCLEGNILYSWSAERNVWIAQRPVGPGMELTLRRSNGDTVRYVTGQVTEEVIGKLRLTVVATEVTTSDSSGRPTRRLRERYAVTLATATGGSFEAPAGDTPGTWKVDQSFELKEVRFSPE